MTRLVAHPMKGIRPACRGMTLPELLVTLTLFSILASLILGGLDFVKHSSERLHTYANQQQQYQQSEHSLNSLFSYMAVTKTATTQDFQGSKAQWAGSTLYPLGVPPGRLTRFRLILVSDQQQVHLYYESAATTADTAAIQSLFTADQPDSGQPGWLLATWPAATAPAFQYLNQADTWQDNWNGDLPHLLPKAICLCSATAPSYLFQVRTRMTAPPRPLNAGNIIDML